MMYYIESTLLDSDSDDLTQGDRAILRKLGNYKHHDVVATQLDTSFIACDQDIFDRLKLPIDKEFFKNFATISEDAVFIEENAPGLIEQHKTIFEDSIKTPIQFCVIFDDSNTLFDAEEPSSLNQDYPNMTQETDHTPTPSTQTTVTTTHPEWMKAEIVEKRIKDHQYQQNSAYYTLGTDAPENLWFIDEEALNPVHINNINQNKTTYDIQEKSIILDPKTNAIVKGYAVKGKNFNKALGIDLNSQFYSEKDTKIDDIHIIKSFDKPEPIETRILIPNTFLKDTNGYQHLATNGKNNYISYESVTEQNEKGTSSTISGYLFTVENYFHYLRNCNITDQDLWELKTLRTTNPTEKNKRGIVILENSKTMVKAPSTASSSTTTYSTPRAEIIDPGVTPKIFISPEALARMGYYVDECDQEIGWMGTCTRNKTEESDIITIHEVFLLRQGVHATTTELDPESISELAYTFMSNNEIDRYSNLKVWGHSHVRMATNPSGQDDSQMNTLKNGGHPYMIRLIANKLGDIRIDLYDWENNIKWERLRWAEEPDQALNATIEHELSLIDAA